MEKWTVDRPATQVDPVPLPPPVLFEGSGLAMRSDLESEHKLTQTPAVSGLRNVSRQLRKVQ